MGKIIDDLLKEIPSNEMVIQIQEICNEIWKEEKEGIKDKYHNVLPDGANIFLALEVPSRHKGNVSFLTLEREPMDEYVSNYYSMKICDIQHIPQMPKKYQSHKLEGRSAKKILIEFAKLVKFYRGA